MVETMLMLIAANCDQSVPPHPRALWVWKADAIVNDASRWPGFFKFLESPKGDPKARISVIFLACKVKNSSNGRGLARFLGEAHHRRLRVDYLCGDAGYATPERAKEGLDLVADVLQHNRTAPNPSRFDGIQFDVEPYSLPGWPKQSILEGYLSFLSQVRNRIDQSKQTLSFGAAIPRWFDGANLHGLYKSVLDRVDYVAVMDYVSKPDQFVSDALNTVKYASEKGKDVWLGAEVSELPLEKSSTFYSLGNAKLEATFAAAAQRFEGSRGFKGVAIEWYDTYLSLRP